jgi:hypothetical protein
LRESGFAAAKSVRPAAQTRTFTLDGAAIYSGFAVLQTARGEKEQ